MDMRELFLTQHGAVHTAAVGGNKASPAHRRCDGFNPSRTSGRARLTMTLIAYVR